MASGSGTILVADDDPGIRDLYQAYLGEQYETETVANGKEALDALNEHVDVLVLDRDMPELRGEKLARTVYRREYDCFVVMVSGIEPDFDLIELPVDEYLVKPVSQSELVGAIRAMRERTDCQRELREFFSLAARKQTLETRKDATELANSQEYRRLTERLEESRAAVDDLLDELEGEQHERFLESTDGGVVDGVLSASELP